MPVRDHAAVPQLLRQTGSTDSIIVYLMQNIKEAVIESACSDLRQKFPLTEEKNTEILADFKFSDADQGKWMA